ncbi:MAG TPA: hydroxyacid dehydrogenase [Candidatus Avilachnospira avicola]|nr:hydroxyacid dehydrogenase [Candidatus Avilachnospira avicola]
MKIVVLEPLSVSEEYLRQRFEPVLAAGNELVCYDAKTSDKDEQIRRAEDADILVIANTPLSGDVIRACHKLRYLAVAFTGVDHVDLAACREKGVAVSNAAGYSTNGVTELVFGLIVALYRYMLSCDERSRSGGTKDGLQGRELYGKTFGVVGTGAIGRRVAMIAKAFGCDVLAYNRSRKPELEELGVRYVELSELMEKSDIVSVHVPSNAETKRLINADMIGLMKKSAILINTARGPVVDNDALAEALIEGRIAGAGIDVFDMEPPIPSDYRLLKAPNTVLTPHVAFATDEAMEIRAQITADNVRHWLDGDQINKVL